jgi:hypothetical protein
MNTDSFAPYGRSRGYRASRIAHCVRFRVFEIRFQRLFGKQRAARPRAPCTANQLANQRESRIIFAILKAFDFSLHPDKVRLY